MQKKTSLAWGFDAAFLPKVFRVVEKLLGVFNADNNIHEKITRFWLAESSAVQV